MKAGMKSVDFLDVTLHLESGSYEPFRKDELPPVYINKKSNHPKAITKNLPDMIEKKLNGRCSNRASFDKHKEFYESALKNSGYKTRLTFTEKTPTTQAPRKPRFKQIFWFL